MVEIQPIGPDSGAVVWEWHVWDHLIQDFDPLAQNYGTVADHPELVDINFVPATNNNPDWLHTNSIDYNPQFDQIMLSIPFLNEIWIIDHSTTSAEAASHTGGNSGKGGDLLYRWGNPAGYDQGTLADQDLFFNHAALWIGPGLHGGDPDIGKIMVFNNRVEPGTSAVDIFVPPVDGNGNYAYTPGTAYGPLDREQRFALATPTDLNSPGQGSAQKLYTGNVLITSGRQGWNLQVRPDSTVAWSYILPMFDGVPVPQGTEILDRTILFQSEWLLADDDRLQGRVLDPIGYIELDPDTTFCAFSVAVAPGATPAVEAPWVTAREGQLTIHGLAANTTFVIHDAAGRVVRSGRISSSDEVIDVGTLRGGVYALRTERAPSLKFVLAE